MFVLDAVPRRDAMLLAETDAARGERVMAPDWSLDGTSVYFVRDGAGMTGSKLPRRIVRRDLASGEEKELAQIPGYVFWMSLAPDGSQLAFAAAGSLQVLPVTGQEPRAIVEADSACGVAWTPDGRYLLFGKKVGDGRTQICRIASTGGEPQKTGLTLHSNMGTVWYPEIRIHPDGKQIAFADRTDDESEVWALENFLPPPTATPRAGVNELRSPDK